MNFALVNIAHSGRNPRHDRAAFRILGLFQSAEDAKRHISVCPSDVDVFLVPCSKWIALATTNEVDQTELLERLGRENKERLQAHEEEFLDNVGTRKTGKTTCRGCEASEGPRPQLGAENAGEGHGRPLPHAAPGSSLSPQGPLPVRRDAELRMQRFAVISLLPDASVEDVGKQQPAFLIWGAVDTEAEGKALIRDELAGKAQDVNIDVVAMYEFLNVPTFEEIQEVDEEWRDEKLSEIMKAKKTHSTKVAHYEAECERTGRAMQPIEIINAPETDDRIVDPIPVDAPLVDSRFLLDGLSMEDAVARTGEEGAAAALATEAPLVVDASSLH
jgi:hypothetical protein